MAAVLPAADLRSNVGTWCVSDDGLPAVAYEMAHRLPLEEFDPTFRGQHLETTYFDTPGFDLKKARAKADHYLTLRIRCYRPPGEPGGAPAAAYALSVKTEDQKFRLPLPAELAEALLARGASTPALAGLLPADLAARVMDLAGDEPLQPVVAVCFRRYAVEDGLHRLTLDCAIRTDTGKCYPCNVLEQKSADRDSTPLVVLPLRPVKLSKFLWALC